MKRTEGSFGKNKESAGLEIYNYWVPTRESAEKISFVQIECALNKPYPLLKDRTPFEDTIIHRSASNFFGMSPYLKKMPFFKYYKRMLPLNDREFTYKSVYSKTGGLLNIFNPRIREAMDNKISGLMDKYEDKREAIGIWKNTASELWSDLPPGLVWAGGAYPEYPGALNFPINSFLEILLCIIKQRPLF